MLANTPRKVREQLKNEIIAKKITQYFHQKKASHDFFNSEKSLFVLTYKKKKNKTSTKQAKKYRQKNYKKPKPSILKNYFCEPLKANYIFR